MDGSTATESIEEMLRYDVILTALVFLGIVQVVPSKVIALETVSFDEVLRCAALTLAPARGTPLDAIGCFSLA